MLNSRALASRESAIRQGILQPLYGEGTGSVIVEAQSVPYQAALSDWGLLLPFVMDSQGWSHATTGACFFVVKNHVVAAEPPAAMESHLEPALPSVALSPASVLDRVRAVFGLNISETAEVFGITRQTAYQWIKLTDMAQVRAHENRDRLKQLYGAAQSWQALPPLKGRWLHALLPTGNTVLDLLKNTQVNIGALRSAYEALAASTANRRREEGERATQAAEALAGAFAGVGAGRKAQER